MRYEELRAQAEAACQGLIRGERLRSDTGASNVAGIRQMAAFEHRVALRNSGRINPWDIHEYIAMGAGYSGLAWALRCSPEELIQELGKSGLRGRGGAGYPTAWKWRVCREAGEGEKYVICNAVDADPWAQTARLLLSTDPHSILEGLLIAAYAVGAGQCFVSINSDYREEIGIVEQALEQMRGSGVLGDSILESAACCDIAIREVSSSLVAGEETALICALENKQPLPYLRMHYPAERGLHGKPTLVHNAETLANVSAIFHRCAAPGNETGYETGQEQSRGTKIVTVHGQVPHPCTVEVPFGTTVRTLIEKTQGASLSGLGTKAVQFGGPTGAFLAGPRLDTPITYEDIEKAGSIIGSGGVRVIAGGGCAVEMAREVMSYLRDQSCGKCVVCREGTYQVADMLGDIAQGRGSSDDLKLLVELGEAMTAGSICGLGREAANPLRSSLALFADDYEAHIDGHVDSERCPARTKP